MKILIHSPALRSQFGVRAGEPVEVDDERAKHFIKIGSASPAKTKKKRKATKKAEEKAVADDAPEDAAE